MKTVADIANAMSERLMQEISDTLADGFEPWHWWDECVDPGCDKRITAVRRYGFFTLVKRFRVVDV